MKKLLLLSVSFFVVGCVTQPQVSNGEISTPATMQGASNKPVKQDAPDRKIATPSHLKSSLPSSDVFSKRIAEISFKHRNNRNSASTTTLEGAGCRDSVSGWRRVHGSCDDAGRLNGFGSAVKDNVYIAGNFANGLPNGPMAITFITTNSIRDQQNLQPKFTCVIEFLNGNLGNELHCDQRVVDIAKPGGIVRIISSLNRFSFESIANQRYGRVNSIVGRGVRIEANWVYRESILGGDVVSFNADGIDMRLLPQVNAGNEQEPLDLSVGHFQTTATVVVNNPTTRGRGQFNNGAAIATVEGPFEFSTRQGLVFQAVSRAKFNSVSGESVIAIHGSHLYKMNLNGKEVSAVFLRYRDRSGGDYKLWSARTKGNPAFDAEVIYLKDGDFEFDAGRYEACDAKTGGAQITYKYFDKPDFLPRCGYLKDFKSGKEYFGNFDSKGLPIGRY